MAYTRGIATRRRFTYSAIPSARRTAHEKSRGPEYIVSTYGYFALYFVEVSRSAPAETVLPVIQKGRLRANYANGRHRRNATVFSVRITLFSFDSPFEGAHNRTLEPKKLHAQIAQYAPHQANFASNTPPRFSKSHSPRAYCFCKIQNNLRRNKRITTGVRWVKGQKHRTY